MVINNRSFSFFLRSDVLKNGKIPKFVKIGFFLFFLKKILRTVTNKRSFIFLGSGGLLYSEEWKNSKIRKNLGFFFIFLKKILRTVTNNRSFIFYRFRWASVF